MRANQDAGTITYLSSFDFAAAASIVDVVVAEQSGYFDDLCLDVELLPSFSTANYPLVASNEAQFSSAGNYTEILNNTGEGAEFVAFVNYGKVADRSADHPRRWRDRPRRSSKAGPSA